MGSDLIRTAALPDCESTRTLLTESARHARDTFPPTVETELSKRAGERRRQREGELERRKWMGREGEEKMVRIFKKVKYLK